MFLWEAVGHPLGREGEIPRLLSIQHGYVNAFALAGFCLAGVTLIATIVLAAYSCCERIVLAVQQRPAFFGGWPHPPRLDTRVEDFVALVGSGPAYFGGIACVRLTCNP